MNEFSKLAQKQAGRLTLWGILAVAGMSAMAGGGYLVYQGHLEEQNLVQSLRGQAAALSAEKGAMGKIREHFDAEEKRIEAARAKNEKLLSKAALLSEWLPVLPGSPTIEELTREEAAKYDASKALLSTQRADAEKIWAAIENPQDVPRLKAGLTRESLAVYASARDCAVRDAGEGVLCGPSAALGARLAQVVDQATALQEQSEAFARQNLGKGWNEWDAAQTELTQSAFAGIEKARSDAKLALDRGDIDQEDWNAMSTGFDAAKTEAANQIDQDRAHLYSATRSGHLSAFDWYLLSRWTQSAPIQTSSIQSSAQSSQAIAHPYVVGGSAYVPPAQVLRSQPQLASAALAAQSPRMALSVPIAPPAGVNPYSVDSGASRLGAKVNASFAKAAGPRVSMALSQSGASKGGMAARLSAYSAARGAARAGSIASGGRVGVSAGHSSAGGHGGGGSSGG